MVVTCLPPESHPEDLAGYFETAGVVLCFTDGETVGKVREAARIVGLGREKVVMLEEEWERKEATVNDLIKEGESMVEMGQTVKEWKPEKRADETCAFLCFSSGTTGKPKAVRILIHLLSLGRVVLMASRSGSRIQMSSHSFAKCNWSRDRVYPILSSVYSHSTTVSTKLAHQNASENTADRETSHRLGPSVTPALSPPSRHDRSGEVHNEEHARSNHQLQMQRALARPS